MVSRNHYVATGYVYDRNTDRFLLIRHKKSGKWLAPGGHLHGGEEPHKGAQRELFEEIGVEGRPLNLLETPQVETKLRPSSLLHSVSYLRKFPRRWRVKSTCISISFMS